MLKESAEFSIIGRVGKRKRIGEGLWVLDVAHNLFNGETQTGVIWFNLICSFSPKVNVGDLVLATGRFDESKNPKFPYALKARQVIIVEPKRKPEKEKREGHH